MKCIGPDSLAYAASPPQQLTEDLMWRAALGWGVRLRAMCGKDGVIGSENQADSHSNSFLNAGGVQTVHNQAPVLQLQAYFIEMAKQQHPR